VSDLRGRRLRLVGEVGCGEACQGHPELGAVVEPLEQSLAQGERRVAQEQRRPVSELLGELERAVVDRGLGDDLVDESECECRWRVDLLLGEREVAGAVDASSSS
jgi:hypothetical protein